MVMGQSMKEFFLHEEPEYIFSIVPSKNFLVEAPQFLAMILAFLKLASKHSNPHSVRILWYIFVKCRTCDFDEIKTHKCIFSC